MYDLYAPRPLLESEHQAFPAATVGEFLRRDVVTHVEEWDDAGEFPREVWTRAGELDALKREPQPA
jgi:acyl-CoA dehydrogenase-like protein